MDWWIIAFISGFTGYTIGVFVGGYFWKNYGAWAEGVVAQYMDKHKDKEG